MSDKFTIRSYQTELLDAPNIPNELLFQNLRELDFINKTLGGHSITMSGIKELIIDKTKTYTIVDIGCGGGDTIKYLADWARKNNYKVRVIGLDMNADTIDYMNTNCSGYSEISGVVADYRKYIKQDMQVDIFHCSLFCHHLKDNELIELFDYLKQFAKVGFVINDLERNRFAYYSIKILTRLFNGSSLVKNDAPLSVLRGFKKSELVNLFIKAKVENVSIKWKWAFRYLIVGKK